LKVKVLKILFWVLVFGIVSYGCNWLWVAAVKSVPNAEDFTLSIAPRDNGFVSSVINLLTFFDSRYTANMLHGLNLLVFNRYDMFYLMPLICFTLFVLSVFFFLSSVFAAEGKRVLLLCYVLFFLVGFFAVEPSLPFGLFYMASTFTYVYPWFFFFVWMGCFVRSKNKSGIGYLLYTLLGLIALFLSFGCSELFIVINTIVLFSLSIIIWKLDRAHKYSLTPYILVALSSIAFIVTCPSGKLIHDNMDGNPNVNINWLNIINRSVQMNWTFLRMTVLTPITILLVLANTSFWLILRPRFVSKGVMNKKHLLVIFIMLIVLAYISSMVYFISLTNSEEFPYRIFNTTLLIILFAIHIILPLVFVDYLFDLMTDVKLYAFSCIIMTGVLLSYIFLPNNFLLIKQEDETGILDQVKNDYVEFYQNVRLVKQAGISPSIVYLKNPSVVPKSNYFGPDVLPNRKAAYWNITFEQYFQVDEVRLKGDSIFKKDYE